jgi:hypothetical protein
MEGGGGDGDCEQPVKLSTNKQITINSTFFISFYLH